MTDSLSTYIYIYIYYISSLPSHVSTTNDLYLKKFFSLHTPEIDSKELLMNFTICLIYFRKFKKKELIVMSIIYKKKLQLS